MPFADAVLSALLNLVLLAGLPFGGYLAYQKWRHRRSFAEVCRRAGLQIGDWRYLGYGLAFLLISVAGIACFAPMGPLTREGSAARQFVGLGLNSSSVALAFLYGMVKTGFPEELLFRGLIAGSLSRRLPLAWANLLQALIFLLPHLLLLWIMPEMWGLLVLIFFGALLLGWIRIRSGSILGPWLIHGGVNVAVALIVAIRTSV